MSEWKSIKGRNMSKGKNVKGKKNKKKNPCNLEFIRHMNTFSWKFHWL